MATPGGFDIELDITEPSGYWDRWTEVDLGMTSWTHRPLDTMVLPLAYVADDEGNPLDIQNMACKSPDGVSLQFFVS